MILANTPSLGLLIGLPVAIFFFVAGLVVAKVGRPYDEFDAKLVYWGGLLVAAIALLAAALSFWPYKWEYHSWASVDGRVDKISSRLVSAGDKGGSNQRFVVVIDGTAYGVDDTRASLLKVGDTVHLKCKREYEWGAANNGYGCRWNGGADG